RPIRPASGATGPSAHFRPDVFRPQLWVSAGPVGTSGGSGCTAPSGKRLPICRGPRPRKVFRQSESRPLDVTVGQPRDRYTLAETRSRVVERGGSGEWLGQCHGGGYPARRPSV